MSYTSHYLTPLIGAVVGAGSYQLAKATFEK